MTENQIGTFTDYGQPDFAMEEVAVDPAVSNHPVLKALNEKIEKLEKDLAVSEQYRSTNADQLRSVRYDHDSKKLKLKDVLVELVNDEDLEYDHAKTIADIFDIILTKQVEIEYTITATATIEVPINADPDEVADNVYCERVDFSTYESDYEVLESDYDVTDWNIRS